MYKRGDTRSKSYGKKLRKEYKQKFGEKLERNLTIKLK